MDDLYIMQCGRGGPIKIGRSSDPWRRQVNMQSNSPYEIDTLLVLRGRGDEEEIWHKAFGGDHLRGEWFDWTPEAADAVAKARAGENWWECLFPPFDMIADWTAEHLDDSEAFEEAYTDCVWSWRNEIANDFFRQCSLDVL